MYGVYSYSWYMHERQNKHLEEESEHGMGRDLQSTKEFQILTLSLSVFFNEMVRPRWIGSGMDAIVEMLCIVILKR